LDKNKEINHFRDLIVYRRAFKAAMTIFQLKKAFPTEENLDAEYEEIIAMLNSMENKADKFCF